MVCLNNNNNNIRTISLAGHGVPAAGAVLVWSVASVPSEEGCRGRHGEAATMTLLTKQQRGAAIISSYDEEKAAMRMALEWLSPSQAAAAICTHSQSLLKAIQSGSVDTADLRRIFNK